MVDKYAPSDISRLTSMDLLILSFLFLALCFFISGLLIK